MSAHSIHTALRPVTNRFGLQSQGGCLLGRHSSHQCMQPRAVYSRLSAVLDLLRIEISACQHSDRAAAHLACSHHVCPQACIRLGPRCAVYTDTCNVSPVRKQHVLALHAGKHITSANAGDAKRTPSEAPRIFHIAAWTPGSTYLRPLQSPAALTIECVTADGDQNTLKQPRLGGQQVRLAPEM